MAAAKRYSAGTIFLQVSPVFRRFQEDIQEYVKDAERTLGDDMEKAGEKAGRRAGKAAGSSMNDELRKASGDFERDFRKNVDGINSALDGIDTRKLGNGLRAEVASIKKELASIKKTDVTVDADMRKAEEKLAVLEGRLRGVRDEVKIVFRSDIDKALKGFGKIAAAKEAIQDPIDIEVRTGDAERRIGAFERKIKASMKKAADHIDGSANQKIRDLHADLEALGRLRIGIDISGTRMRAEVDAIMRELRQLEQEEVDIDARFNAGQAYAELAAFDQALDHVDGRTVRVRAVANTANAQRGLAGLAASGDDAANSFRSFNIVLFAAAAAGPALIPILGAIAGGLLAIGPAAAVAAFGIGSVLVGFSGLGDVLTAYDAQQKQQAMNAQTAANQNRSAGYAIRDAARSVADAERNAARAAEDAARRVADARRAAADAVKAALKRQEDAQKAYAKSVDDVREAERALAEARRAQRGRGEEIDERLSDNALAQDQGVLDVFNATVAYNAILDDGSATNAEKEQARITLERQRDALDDLRKEEKKLRKEQKKWRKEGVEGTDEVQSAQDRLNNALEAQKEAYESVRDAAADVDRARADGARRVADAIRSQNETLADNARSIERAREGLRRAREASDQMASSLNSQQNAFNDAMGNLGPAGQKFALFLIGLKDDFQRFRNDIQEAMLPSIQEAIEGFIGSKNAGVARNALINLAAGFGDFAKVLSQSFQGPAWAGFFEMLADLGPEIQSAWGNAFVALLEALASMLTTLAPYALEFAEGLAKMMESFAAWAASEEGAAGLARFMDHMKEIGPDVLEFFGAFFLAMTNIMIALAPYSELILSLLTDFLDLIATMDTDVLAGILTSILVLITASQTAYAVMNLLLAGGALLRSSIGLLTFSFVGAALAVYFLYQQNETLGKVVGVLVGVIYAAIIAMRIYRTVTALVALAKFGYITATTGATVATTGLTTAQRVAMAVGRAWAGVMALMKLQQQGLLLFAIRYRATLIAQAVWTKTVTIATRLFAAAQWLLTKAMNANPFFRIVTVLFALGAAMVWAYKKFDGFRKVVDTVVSFVADAFFWLWDFLFGHSVMPDIIDGMEWFFDRLSEIFGWIKAKVIEPLARAFEWLWTNVVKPVLGFIIAYYRFVFRAMRAVWTNVLWPVFKVIGKVVWTLWKAYFKVAFTLIKAYFKTVFWAMKQVWEKVLHPVFKVIGKVVGWLWDKVFKPTLTWIGDKFGDVFRGMKVVWQRVLKPVFDFITDKALPKLKGAFEKTIDAIEKVWGGLKKVVGAPIKFVLDTVINDGLIKGFNKVAKWVKMDGFDPIPIPGWMQNYATGGILPGYTPGRDVHSFVSPTGGRLNLSGGEAIMRPEWTAAVGPDFVNQMNAAARMGGVDGVRRAMRGGSYYLGGILPLFGARVARHGSGYSGYAADLNVGSGSDDYGMPVRAWKSGIIAAMRYIGNTSYGRWMDINHGGQFSRYAHMSGFAPGLTTGMGIRAGQTLGYVGSVGNSSGPHLHFEINGGSLPIGEANLSGGGGGGPKIPGWIKGLLKNPLSTIKGWATDTWDKASSFVKESPAFDVVKKVPNLLVGGIKDKVMDAIPGWAKRAVGVVGDVVGGVKDLGEKGLGLIGLGGSSSGNGGTNEAPTVESAFATGGILPYNGTMMYDNGGYLPPGLTSVVNLTGKPEPVFTNDQWSQMGGAASAGTIHYEPHFEGSDLTAADVAGDLNFTFRKIRRTGKYEGVGRP